MAHSGRRLTIFSPHYSISIRTPRRCPARAWQRSPTRLGSQRCCVWPEAAKTIPQGGFTLQGRLHCCAACWITVSWVWGREERWRCQLLFFSFALLLFFYPIDYLRQPLSISMLISCRQSLSLRLDQFGSTSCRAVAVDDPSLSFAEVPCSSGNQNNNFCCPPKHLHLSYRASSLS